MSSPWGVIGTWAAEAERAEAEENERAASIAAAKLSTIAPLEAFPTPGESLASKPKKKQQTFSLSEFAFGKSVALGSRSRFVSESKGLTPDEMMMLPTGPSDRSGEAQHHSGLGGGFRDYSGGSDRLDRSRDPSFVSGFQSTRETEGFLKDRGREEPSRADQNGDWSSMKKNAYGNGTGFEGVRRAPRSVDREPLPPSRADGVDNWGLAKKPQVHVPASAAADDKRGSYGLDRGYVSSQDGNWGLAKKSLPLARVDPQERRSGRRETPIESRSSRADEMESWTSSKQPNRSYALAPSDLENNSQSSNAQQLDASSTSLPAPAKPKPNPFGSARPREEVLADRDQDTCIELGAKELESRPSSSPSSRLDTDKTITPVGKTTLKVNPFGDARPREVLLKERGQDWLKMELELEHRGLNRLESEEESRLKEEIKHLTDLSKQEAVKKVADGLLSDESMLTGVANGKTALELLQIKERELELLMRALDDKVRFSQRVGERPGSRSGRSDSGRAFEYAERTGSRPGSRANSRPGSRSGRADSRPNSRSGYSDVTMNSDYLDRPVSRSGSRMFESSERSLASWTPGDAWRSAEQGNRRWGRPEGARSHDALDKPDDSGRSFSSLRPDIWTSSGSASSRDPPGSWLQRDEQGDRVSVRRF